MRVFIENLWSLVSENSEVRNENFEPIFTVKGRDFFSISKKKSIYGRDGALLYTVRNNLLDLLFYRVNVTDADGKRVATVKKSVFDLSKKYKILNTEQQITVEGSIFEKGIYIMRNGQEIAHVTVNSSVFSLTRSDSYSLDADEKDIPFLTALVIAIDNLRDRRRR